MSKSSTFIPSQILSSEVKEKIRTKPESQLLWAILEEAVGTYIKHSAAKSRRGQRIFHEAEEWIFQDDHTWLCSFINICHILEIEPDYLRTGLVHWREAQHTRINHEAA
jgi:hypothetical protein